MGGVTFKADAEFFDDLDDTVVKRCGDAQRSAFLGNVAIQKLYLGSPFFPYILPQ